MKKEEFWKLSYEDRFWILYEHAKRAEKRIEKLETEFWEHNHPRTPSDSDFHISTTPVTIPYQEYMRLVRKGGH